MSSPAGVDAFEASRAHLHAVAYRILGSFTEADDAVQEAWLRWAATAPDTVEDPRAWLATVTSRICLDQLRSARVRRERYVGNWLPEPLVRPLPQAADDPAEAAARDDEVSYALLVVMERLSPPQRVAFVLHDVFAVPFDDIAPVLSTTPAAARKLASRARQAVRAPDAPRHTADLAEQRRVVEAFLAAAGAGDIDGLLAVLAPDVVALGDGGGVAPAAPGPVTGSLRVARFMAGLLRRYQREATWLEAELVLVNGDLGTVAAFGLPDGTVLRSALAFAVADGQLTAVYNQLNPAKLSRSHSASLPRPPGMGDHDDTGGGT